MSLRDYARKRRFGETPEPDEVAGRGGRGQARRPMFVVQLHNARARHYDFRLEIDGALKSWAVPKGPSFRAGEKRLAVQVEDHPLAYSAFEGEIPTGNYGAGHVLVFDSGVWACEGDPLQALASGKLDFTLYGEKLQGGWKLIRTQPRGGKPQWLLVKRDDSHARDAEADDLVGMEPGPATSKDIAAGVRRAKPAKRSALPGGNPAKSSTPAKSPRRSEAKWRKRALAIPAAKDHPLAPGFRPQLATARDSAPAGLQWLHEVKWDGYRMLADLVEGKARLRSRNGLDWTSDFPEIVAALHALPVADARLDGELVALDGNGTSDFALLQRSLQGASQAPLRYMLFDLPGLAGVDLSTAPLLARKQLLEQLLEDAHPALGYSSHVLGNGAEVFAASGKQGLEGIISKRGDATYSQGRSADWIKVKHVQADEFVVVGYSAPKGSRTGLGALLLATPGPDGLRYVGRVGTGFSDATLKALATSLQPLRQRTATVALPPHLPHAKRDRGDIHWLQPGLVVEVAFRGWGKDGLLRHSSFLRVREDKTPGDIQMPTPLRPSGTTTGTSRSASAKPGRRKPGNDATHISSPERVVYADAGITKGEVADYYRAIAPWILPGLANRPLSLLRCPSGAGGECFFQKHHAESLGAAVGSVALQQKSGIEDYLYVRDAAGLLELVQMNTLEFHPWGSRIDKVELPDNIVFDLDPGPGIDWPAVVAAAREVRARLREAGLESFIRLSGGKGVHVVVPLRRGPGWERIRDFSAAFAEALAAHHPLTFVANMSKAKRHQRIFVDWLRNARGATSVCNWSLRARPGAPVAVPIRWEDLGRMPGPDALDLRSAPKRARAMRRDPWDGYATLRQRLPALAAKPC